MKLYQLYRRQVLATDIESAWRFFADPRNLARITPAWLNLTITAMTAPTICAGMIINYRLTPFGRLPVAWVSEITHAQRPHAFVDEQRMGPYRFWHHRHSFSIVQDGICMEDTVVYALYGGLAGRLLHTALVQKRLKAIFAFRRQTVGRIFGAVKPDEHDSSAAGRRP